MKQLLRRILPITRLQVVERERLLAALKTAPDAILIVDRAHRVVNVNDAAIRFFAAQSNNLRGKQLGKLLAPWTYAQYLAACNAPPGTDDEPARGEARRADGARCAFEYTLSAFSDGVGHRFHALALRPLHARRAARDDTVDALFRQSEMRQAAIARELHDAVGSSLAGVSLMLAAAQSYAREPEAAALIGRSQKQVTMITQQVRQISRGMLPAGEVRGALLAALDQFAADMSAIPGVRCTVRSRGDFEQVPADVGNHLYRIVQEATTNALHHGHAARVRITLARGAASCRLTVQDDGRGCEPDLQHRAASGIGIRSMHARAEAIGGAFSILSRPGRGTRIQVTWHFTSAAPRSTPGASPGLTPLPAFRPAVR